LQVIAGEQVRSNGGCGGNRKTIAGMTPTRRIGR
jgi:hypothetical protein